MPRYSSADFIDADDIARAKARSPHARQNCPGSMVQLMVDAGDTVICPECTKKFSSFDTQKNRSQRCPIVPSHLPDHAGRQRVLEQRLKRHRSSTPRPY